MTVAIVPDHMPPVVRAHANELVAAENITSATPVFNSMRMIKSDHELQLARHAGQVADAMMNTGRNVQSRS